MFTDSPARRRLFVVLALLLGLGISTAACGDGGSDSAATAATTDDGATAASSETEGEFPATVEHRHGTTTIDEMPRRIVTVGFSDQDSVLAFGVAPVAVMDWYGEYEFGTWEWAQDELGDAEPEVLNKGAFTGTADYNYEQLAALEPDLIIGLYTDMDDNQYEKLSQIAPTVAPSGDYPEYGMPWQESVRMVGDALGQPDRADELIEDVETEIAGIAADHPEFDGVEAVVVEAFEPGSSFSRSATDPRTKLMDSLGFVLPAELAELAGDKDGAEISDEKMTLLDRDLLVWNVGHDDSLRPEIESKPLYPQLDVVEAGRSVFIEDPIVSGALTWGTVLSLPYAAAELAPQLSDALAP